MELKESSVASMLLAVNLPNQVHSRLGSGSSSSPCTPAMQRAHFNQVSKNFILNILPKIRVTHLDFYPEVYPPFFSQNANLRSSRESSHSSSMSDMVISPLSPFTPMSPTDSVFWDSAEAPPKVSIVFLCPPVSAGFSDINEA